MGGEKASGIYEKYTVYKKEKKIIKSTTLFTEMCLG